MLALAEDWSYSLTHYQANGWGSTTQEMICLPVKTKVYRVCKSGPKSRPILVFSGLVFSDVFHFLSSQGQDQKRESYRIRDKEIASRKDDGRWSFGQEMWTSFSLAPTIRRYRDLIEHKIWAVNGKHQTHALALFGLVAQVFTIDFSSPNYLRYTVPKGSKLTSSFLIGNDLESFYFP